MKKLKCTLSLFWLKCDRSLSSLSCFFMLEHAKLTVVMSYNHKVSRYLRIFYMKTRNILVFFWGGEVKCGSNWSSLQTSELFHSGPCKALVGCVFQQQGYQISYRKSYLNFSTNRICSMKKLKCILSYFDLNMWEAGHHFSVSSC